MDASNNVTGSNSGPTLDDLKSTARSLGKTLGKGARALPELATELVDNAGVVGIGKGETDLKDIFEAFQAATGKDVPSSLTVQVSKLKPFVVIGQMASIDASGMIRRARELISYAEDKKGSLFANMNRVAIAQTKQETELTDDEILEAIAPSVKSKDELARLNAIHKAMVRTRDGTDEEPGHNSPELVVAIDAVSARIVELEAQVLELKRQEEDLALAAKRGQLTWSSNTAPSATKADLVAAVEAHRAAA